MTGRKFTERIKELSLFNFAQKHFASARISATGVTSLNAKQVLQIKESKEDKE